MRPRLRAARVSAAAGALVALLAACSGPTELTWEEHCAQLRSTAVADVAAVATPDGVEVSWSVPEPVGALSFDVHRTDGRTGWRLVAQVEPDVEAPGRWSVVVDRDDEPSGARGASYAVLPEGCPVEDVEGDLQAFVVAEGGPTS